MYLVLLDEKLRKSESFSILLVHKYIFGISELGVEACE
jgi:hypothetical protein